MLGRLLRKDANYLHKSSSTLSYEDRNVYFRLFNEAYTFTWKEFSLRLGFPDSYSIDLDEVLKDFNREIF